MSQIFFKIGNTDYSAYIDQQNFLVNNEEIFSTWTDINGTEHRDHIRTRVSGSFVMGFRDSATFASVVSAISTALATNGYTSCQIYCNNTGTTLTVDAYLTLTGEAKYDFTNSRQWQTLQIEITER